MTSDAKHGLISFHYSLIFGSFALDAALEVPGRGATAIFGRSGSGKTTLLRCMAGLTKPREGKMQLGETVWEDSSKGIRLPAWKRPIGFVFQDSRLFTHLTARGNLEYGLKRTPVDARAVALHDAAAWMGIEPLLDRAVSTLSGGEQKRVAIARAILTSPKLLLMDEPLAGLDAQAAGEILSRLERLRDALSIPILYVSHSMDEVARLADHLALMENGTIRASGPLLEMAARLDLPLAAMDEGGAILETTVAEHDAEYYLTRLEFAGGSLWVSHRDSPVGQRLRVRVPARDVSLALDPPARTSIQNVIAATVVEISAESPPGQVTVKLDASGAPLLSRVTRKSAERLALAPGLKVHAQIKSVALLK